MAKQTLINNGLPEGLHFKDIKPGDILLVMYRDGEPEYLIVVDALDSRKPRTFKGYVSFKCIGANGVTGMHTYVESDQVIRKTGSVLNDLATLNGELTGEERDIRYQD